MNWFKLFENYGSIESNLLIYRMNENNEWIA